jgi:sulfatase modifying factor 1
MKNITLILLASSVFFSFSSTKEKYTNEFDLRSIERSMIYIPPGSFAAGGSDTDVPYEGQEKFRTVSLQAFYTCKHELTNGEYRVFLYELRKTDTAAYRKMLPDTLVWREKLAYNEPYVDYYLRHPSYTNYPVVGVTHEQAEFYCTWLTKRYAQEGKRKYKTAVFMLPSSDQWEYAARGGLDLSPFPWSGPYMQNKKGEWMANFKIINQASVGRMEFEKTNVYGKKYMETYYVGSPGGNYMGTPGKLNDAADITVPVLSYFPNEFGLYNMAGNVEEYVAEKGITRGGSWKDTGYYLQNSTIEKYDSTSLTSSERGFRYIMVEKN